MIDLAQSLPAIAAHAAAATRPSAPRRPAAARRPMEEDRFLTHDSIDLFYRHWPAQGASLVGESAGAVVLIHRGHEHSGRMAHLVEELALPGFAFFAFDARGHGRSPGLRGHSPGVTHSVHDIQSFVAHIAARHGIPESRIAVVAQSFGAVAAAAWVHDYAPNIRCLALAAPAFQVKFFLPFARAGLALLHKLRGDFFVKTYVGARYLTHDPERRKSFAADPLITREVSAGLLLDLHATAARVIADAAAITVPTQLLISGGDCVVHLKPQHDFYAALGAADKERHVFEGFYHDTLGELDRAEPVHRLRSFILRHFD